MVQQPFLGKSKYIIPITKNNASSSYAYGHLQCFEAPEHSLFLHNSTYLNEAESMPSNLACDGMCMFKQYS